MSKVNIYAGLTAEQKEAIMAARNQQKAIDTGKGIITWKVQLVDSKPFTFLSEFARTPEQVKAAMLEKFCRPAVSVVRL